MGHASVENKDVSWKVLEIEISGTITGPKEANSGIVFVAGSGPTDRNWCSPLLPGTNGSGKLLAEELAREGFLTLRYDKMASGPHVRENLPKFSGKASMETHMEELQGAVEALITEKNVNDLFVLTNSEGAIHAVNYELQSNLFKGLVLTGAPGRSIGDVSRSQLAAQARAFPDPEKFLQLYDAAIAEFMASKPMTYDPALPEPIRPFLRSLENPNNLPFSRELWAYNLPEHITKVQKPITVLIGKKDIQIDWKMDGEPLERATAKNLDASFAYPENANHVLKHEELPWEKLTAEYVGTHYNAPDAVLDRETVDWIVHWLKEQST